MRTVHIIQLNSKYKSFLYNCAQMYLCTYCLSMHPNCRDILVALLLWVSRITKLHSVYKHVHNCMVHWCPEMTSIISVCEYQCCILVQCSVFCMIYQCSILVHNSSIFCTVFWNIHNQQLSLFWNIHNCTVSMFCTGTVFSVLEYL